MGNAFHGISLVGRRGILEVLLAYLRRSSDVINGPGTVGAREQAVEHSSVLIFNVYPEHFDTMLGSSAEG